MHTIATIGTFDGVHAGHRTVIRTLLHLAQELEMQPLVFAFANHPLDIIAPDRRPPRLQDAAMQQQMLTALGVEVIPIHFTRKMMMMTSAEYMQMLRDRYDVRALVVGYDNRFGHDRDATLADYVATGRGLGIQVFEAPELPEVSSSAIRCMLADGDVMGAARALGYPYSITGTVVHGKELGRTIGFPTANIRLDDIHRHVPADGVYACYVTLPDGERFAAMANIGHRPTVRDHRHERSIEVHIIGLDRDLYGQQLTLTFADRLRSEIKFDSLDALKRQLVKDREDTLAMLKGVTVHSAF